MFACPAGWARLPRELQEPITRHHRGNRDRHADAMLAARDWFLDHPAPRDPDADVAGVCEHCDGALLWLTTAAGKRMPVDAAPDPDRGNVIRTGAVAGVLGPGPAAAARAAGQPLWLHHVVTCPHADRWRSTGKTRSARASAGRRSS
jgi:hypothetical protein